MHGLLAARMSGFASSHDWTLLAGMVPLGIAFGAVHALTPGHGKSLLASYLVGSPLSALRSLTVAGAQALTHVGSAVILALVALPLFTRTLGGVGRAPSLEILSRGLLMAIGTWLIVRAWRGYAHHHGSREGAMVGVVAGLVPCPLTLFAMVMAVARGVPEAGLAFALAMVIGVGLTLGGVAGMATVARTWVMRLTERYGSSATQLSRVLDAAAGTALITIALYELSAK